MAVPAQAWIKPAFAPYKACLGARPIWSLTYNRWIDPEERTALADYGLFGAAAVEEATQIRRYWPQALCLQVSEVGGVENVNLPMEWWEFGDTVWSYQQSLRWNVQQNLRRGVDWRLYTVSHQTIPWWTPWVEMINYTSTAPPGLYGSTRGCRPAYWLRYNLFYRIFNSPTWQVNFDGFYLDTYPTPGGNWGYFWQQVDYDGDGRADYCADWKCPFALDVIARTDALVNCMVNYLHDNDKLLIVGQDMLTGWSRPLPDGWKLENFPVQDGGPGWHISEWWTGISSHAVTGLQEAEKVLDPEGVDPRRGSDMSIVQVIRQPSDRDTSVFNRRVRLATAFSLMPNGPAWIDAYSEYGGQGTEARMYPLPKWKFKLPAASSMFWRRDPASSAWQMARYWWGQDGQKYTVVVDTLRREGKVLKGWVHA